MASASYRVDLSRHMAECDANYRRLLTLLPSLFDEDVRRLRLRLPGAQAPELRFLVEERAPYTTTLAVQFKGGGSAWHPLIRPPALRLRLYHDCQTAEVLAYQGQDRFEARYAYPNAQMRLPDEKAQLNAFLGEYLALCLAQGIDAEPLSLGA
jgi:uncharacterized protein YqiB (DUF1249 family)